VEGLVHAALERYLTDGSLDASAMATRQSVPIKDSDLQAAANLHRLWTLYSQQCQHSPDNSAHQGLELSTTGISPFLCPRTRKGLFPTFYPVFLQKSVLIG
jgi:hypothetical protein